jgi:hypothetical protein
MSGEIGGNEEQGVTGIRLNRSVFLVEVQVLFIASPWARIEFLLE